MKTRMEKYYSEDGNTLSRSSKNRDLYKEVSTTDIESFDLNSNVSILGDNSKNIDLDKIQEILDRKYRQEPRKRASVNAEREPETELNLDETREYDINAILDKAKETKEVDYEVDRLKKLRNTQYDILNNLDLSPKDEDELDDITSEQAKLMDLINTITSKELANDIKKEQEKQEVEEVAEESDAEIDPLDILSDLRGDNENTITLGADLLDEVKKETMPIPAPEPVEEKKEDEITTKEFAMDDTNEITSEITKEDPVAEILSEISKDQQPTSENMFNTTGSIQFSQSDFDDFNDLKDDMKAAKIIIKILIVLIIVAFIVGCVFLVNNIFDLGLI